jgi:hypothetical protein
MPALGEIVRLRMDSDDRHVHNEPTRDGAHDDTNVPGSTSESDAAAKPLLGIVLVLCALYIGCNIGVARDQATAKPTMFILTDGYGRLASAPTGT